MAKADPEAAAGGKGRRRRARRGPGQHAGTAAQKGPKAAAVAALPRSPQEFSSNWKALQEVRASRAGCRALHYRSSTLGIIV